VNSVQRSALDIKRNWLHTARATVRPEANVQDAGNKVWQSTTPITITNTGFRGLFAGVYQIPYPLVGVAANLLCSYQVPPSMSGALTGLATVHNGLAGSFIDNSGLAVWHLTINGCPVPGFENILSQLGSFENPLGTYLLLQENDLLAIWVGGPVYTTGAGLPLPPVGFPSALLTGYLCYGGQGTYTNPRSDSQDDDRGAAANRYSPGSNNGSPPNTASGGPSFNRHW
jgi:hypothetical protein